MLTSRFFLTKRVLQCHATGVPAPDITWTIDTDATPVSGPTLTLTQLMKDTTATCHAKNNVGVAQIVLDVQVAGNDLLEYHCPRCFVRTRYSSERDCGHPTNQPGDQCRMDLARRAERKDHRLYRALRRDPRRCTYARCLRTAASFQAPLSLQNGKPCRCPLTKCATSCRR